MASKQHIISLDAWVEPPEFDFDHTLTVIRDDSATSRPEQLRDATILMFSGTPVTRNILDNAPNARLLAANGTGVDHVDVVAVRERGLTLCKVPAQNTDSVSEHAFALYYALRRQVLRMHQLVMEGKEWPERKTVHAEFGHVPRTNVEERLIIQYSTCIIGYGALGANVEKIAKALGMTVIAAERKGATEVRPGRVAFDRALRDATVFVFVTPLNESTRDMIGAAELEAMQESALLVNVGRGGIINEEALAAALRNGTVGGAATDVFAIEPATKEGCVLLDSTIPNLILSPHIAWYSQQTITNTRQTIKKNIEGFVAGKPQNVVVQGNR
ncbi:hypothetical protein B0A48_10544 [Cryoendolithus antarcticus]|uniref:Glycerate dehydrogenase n=1 Tax=Cryoendolithus antarcticus TaxID=1507870 RepID=A0A1V8SYB3_9PEZI|nr:hypothetical protein B0A48_10544 [Cryoendolithus antarcticus]